MITLTPRCFKGPHLPISIFNSKHPNDQISTAVVYNTSYGPAITRCIATYGSTRTIKINCGDVIITWLLAATTIHYTYYVLLLLSYCIQLMNSIRQNIQWSYHFKYM